MTENADNVIPYLVNYNVRLIYRENVGNLWKDWRRELVKRYRSQIDIVEKEGLTRYQKITSTGYRTSLPRFQPGGKSVYWVRATGYDSPALMVKSLVSQKEIELCDVHYPGSLSVTADGSAYLADLELWRTFSLYSDIFRFDGSYEQITERLRALYLDVTPDGRSAVFVRQENDRYSLMKRDLATGTMTYLIQKTDVQLASPRISPDGKRVVFTMRDRNASTDLVLHDLSGGGFTRLTNDSFSDIHPSWHPNGEKILFSSDRSGIYNLYELSLKEMRIGRITNLLGGAFNPDVSPGGSSIVFANYDQEGYNIALMEYPSAYSGRSLLSAVRLSAEYFSIPGVDLSPPARTSSYSIWSSVLPTWWYPIYFTEEVYEGKYDNAIGISVSGSDTLYRYTYSLSAYFLSFQERAVIDAQLMISTLYPNILLAYYDESLYYGADEFPWSDANTHPTRRSVEKNLSAGLMLPYLSYLSQHMALLAFKHERSTTDMFSPGFVTQRYLDTLAYSHLAYSYNNARNYSYSISDENGRSFYLIYDHFIRGSGSDYQFYKVRGEYSEFLPGLWRNNVFMFRLRGGASVGAPDHLIPYNLGRYEKGERGSPPDDEDAFGMRGYPSGYLYGERLAIGAAEYRMPVVQPDLGFSTTPVMLRDIWIVFFAEYGNVWNGGARMQDFRSSAGIELHAKFTFGYFIDLAGYVGYARGFADPGETQVYFGVSTLYEGAASHRNKWFDFL